MTQTPTAMKPIKRIWKRVILVGAFLSLALAAFAIWNKHDHCGKWADHYAARASQLRAEAENLNATERKQHLSAADWNDIISRKFSAVARQPWKGYPRHPLITSGEQRAVAAKY